MKKFCTEQILKQRSDELHIYDRGYPCMFLFFLHKLLNTRFLARVKVGHNKAIRAFVNSGQAEQVLSLKINKQAREDLAKIGYDVGKKSRVKLRLIRVKTTGEDYILVTNLLDKQSYPLKEIGDLYHLRWGIETGFGYLKNSLQLEVFSGLKPESILQDCFAMMASYNIATHFKEPIQEEIESDPLNRKYPYQVNRHHLIGLLKITLIDLISSSRTKVRQLINGIRLAALIAIEPVRKGRSFPRIHRVFRNKSKYRQFLNHKSVI